MKKISNIGTCFKGLYILSNLNELRKILGPETRLGEPDNKVRHEWIIDDMSDGVITIYDWKEYREEGKELKNDEQILWHVGGKGTNRSLIRNFLIREVGIEDEKIKFDPHCRD